MQGNRIGPHALPAQVPASREAGMSQLSYVIGIQRYRLRQRVSSGAKLELDKVRIRGC